MPAHRYARTIATAVAAVAVAVLSCVAVPSADARVNHDPYGAVTSMHRSGYGVLVAGWAYDPDTSASAIVHVRVDKHRVATVKANQYRPAAARQNRAIGTHRGFSVTVPLTAGPHNVCASVSGYPDTSVNYTIACRTVDYDYNPKGDFTLTQTPGNLTASGWAIDYDAPMHPVKYVIRLDHQRLLTGTADQPDPDFGALHPSAGENHGLSATFPITEGTHVICLKVFNLGTEGTDTYVKCYDPWDVSFSPTGDVGKITQVPGGVDVSGYAVDPDTTAATSVIVRSGGQALATLPANGTGKASPGHTFDGVAMFPNSTPLAAGPRTVCVVARNLGQYGQNRQIGCLTHTFDWDPTGALESAKQQGSSALVTGWASDPDTTSPIRVRLTADGKLVTRVLANGATGSHAGHMFSAMLPLTNGTHSVCAVAVNTQFGSANATPSCKNVTMNFDPYGALESAGRAAGGSDIVATGWAIDPETTKPIKVQVLVDGAMTTWTANVPRPDIAASHPGTGTNHGFSVDIPEPTTDGEHEVCVNAVNIGSGSKPTVPLGCVLVIAVHPTAPAPPSNVTAVGGYGGAQVTWSPSTSDGGAPWTGYTVRTLPSGPSVTVGPGVLSATVTGLQPNTTYTFSVVAKNIAGASKAAVSPAVTTQTAPPPQTSPAPISTSRYIRNITGSGQHDLTTLHSEGAADARANPSGHGYLIVLAIGGQDESRQGVILSAGIRFISYSDIVKNLEAYVDGYAGQQRPSAPLTLAIATNNDIDVYRASGVSFANHVIDPVQAYARRYPGITIAGSDDMEPGFRAGYSATKSWLQGYLSATSAPFVFTGSADGCAWSFSGGSCNNGWTMAGLYYLTAGAYPIRMINLPQIYNTTMAQQWRYISLTGVRAGHPKIDFGGALTEWTACQQAGSCGSLTGNNAWRAMWSALRAEPALRPNSLPYSTDLRIDS